MKGLPHLPYDTVRRRIRRRLRRFDYQSEASFEDLPGVVKYGGQLIWAEGFTSGRAPFGLTAIEALTVGAGVTQKPVERHDVDFLFGSWVDDPDVRTDVSLQAATGRT